MVKDAREAKALTQTQLATLLGVTQPAVAQWESGIGYPEAFRVAKLGAVLGLSVDWLLNAIAADVASTPAKDLTPQPSVENRGKQDREG
jgi:transcriptional regulator with XRE-family HTH domain